MQDLSSCPGRQEYEQFQLGQLGSGEVEQLALHLEQCDRCAALVQKMPADDPLIAVVQSQAAAAPRKEQDVVEDLKDRMRGLRRRDSDQYTIESPAGQRPTRPPHAKAPPAAPEQYDFLDPPEKEDEIGRLGPYRVLRLLGAGGMGIVFLAEDPQLKRSVALKVLKPALAANLSYRQRFLREAQATAAIVHDHIVTIHEVCDESSVPFFAMQFLQGETLDDRIKREKRLPLVDVVRIAQQIAEGLSAAHERGLIHRDIKPSNIWLEGGKGGVKIVDFGLAQAANEIRQQATPEAGSAAPAHLAQDAHLTQHGFVVGTPAYMAPEQARGEPLDFRCDLFSFGSVLYQLCTGELPFKGETSMATLVALALEKPKLPDELNPHLPEKLVDLVMWLLAKDRADRPSSARDVVLVLEDILYQLLGQDLPAFFGDPTAPLGGPEAGQPPPARGGPHGSGSPLAAGTGTPRAGAVPFGGIGVPGAASQRANGVSVPRAEPAAPRKNTATKAERPRGLRGFLRQWLTLAGVAALFRPPEPEAPVPIAEESSPEPLPLAPPSSRPKQRPAAPRPPRSRVAPAGRRWLSITEVLKAIERARTKVTRPGSAPARRARWELIAVALALVAGIVLGSLFGPAILRFALNKGRVTLQSPEDDVRIAVQREGETVAVLDPRNNRQTDLKAGTYHLRLVEGREGNWLVSDTLTVGRSDEQTVEVRYNPLGDLLSFEGRSGPVRGLALSPDGRHFLVSSGPPGDHAIRLWEVASDRSLRSLKGHRDAVTAVVFSPHDGRRALSASADQTVRVWDLTTGRELRCCRGHKDAVLGLALSSNGRRAWSGSLDGTIRLWDVDSGVQLLRLDVDPSGVTSVALTFDGQQILCGCKDGTLRLLDTATGKELRRIKADENPIACVSLTPDGRRAVAASGALTLWDLETGAKLRTFEGHKDKVTCVVLLPDGQRLLSGGQDKTVRLWDLETGKELDRFDTFGEGIDSVAVSANQCRAVCGTDRGTVWFWRLPEAADRKPETLD